MNFNSYTMSLNTAAADVHKKMLGILQEKDNFPRLHPDFFTQMLNIIIY